MLMNGLFINLEIAWRIATSMPCGLRQPQSAGGERALAQASSVTHQTIHKLHLSLQSAINMPTHGLDQDRGAGSNGELTWSIIMDVSPGTN
jgi:hypothetical protein